MQLVMGMEKELKELKSVLRSLVVSSPTEVDLRTLLRDYRNMMGESIPLVKFGYRDGLAFIKEKCSDCFVIQDSGFNPVLTLIVPDAVKHIDKFVQKQKATPTTRFKSKRRSVPEAAFKSCDLIAKTFKAKVNNIQMLENAVATEDKEIKCGNINGNTHMTRKEDNEKCILEVNNREGERAKVNNGVCSTNALQNFMRKRIPIYDSAQCLATEVCLDKDSLKCDTDSGRPNSSSSSSTRKAQLEELKREVRDLIAEVPEGVWCTELMKLYREKHGRELNFSRFGFTSVLSLAYAVEELQYCVAEHSGELLLRAGAGGAGEHGSAVARGTRARLAPAAPPASRDPPTGDPEDALPGIEFDEDVFPRDCMHIVQSIPTQSLDELVPGAMLEVVLGEVYSPTHFWLLRLGPLHYSAMETMMDEMNMYYCGEGRDRVLAGGAVRLGHYCACCYLGDWHRAVIVKIIDSDTVKVRHIDYATVESVETRSLKPLQRRWATLPAQALRARLGGARPPAGGRRWPWAASAHFLTLVKERRLVANVVAKDAQEGILEVLLIDTSTEEDVCIGSEMCRSGHADPRPDSALGVSACYDSSSSNREDIRSLLSIIANFKTDDVDSGSEISASASEVVGRGPRLIETWECDDSTDVTAHPNDLTDDTRSAVSEATARSAYLRLRLAAIRAALISNAHENVSNTETDAISAKSVMRVSPARDDEEGTPKKDKAVLDGSESVLSAIHVRLQMLHKLKRLAASPHANHQRELLIDRTENTETVCKVAAGNANSVPISCNDSQNGNRINQLDADGNKSVCSAVEARVRKIRELKQKRQTSVSPVPGWETCRTEQKFIMVSDRCHITSRIGLGRAESTNTEEAKRGSSTSSSFRSDTDSVVSVATSAVEVRLQKQLEMDRKYKNGAGARSNVSSDTDEAAHSDRASESLQLADEAKLRLGSEAQTSECYLYPRFEALETGDTPNYAEIYCYLRDGISLEFVEDYRRHVPPSLPPAPAATAVYAPRALSPVRRRPPGPDEFRELPPEPSIVSVTKSTCQLADQAAETYFNRATSLSSSFKNESGIKSVGVFNRVMSLCNEHAEVPRDVRRPSHGARRPRSSPSLPSGGLPAPAFSFNPAHPTAPARLSPFAPPFYPQSFAPSPFPPPPPNIGSGAFPAFNSLRPHFYSGPHQRAGPESRLDCNPPVPAGGVSIPASECEIFALLNRVNPAAAHGYMVDALSRAMAATDVARGTSASIPSACVLAGPQSALVPPGFERALNPSHSSHRPPDP